MQNLREETLQKAPYLEAMMRHASAGTMSTARTDATPAGQGQAPIADEAPTAEARESDKPLFFQILNHVSLPPSLPPSLNKPPFNAGLLNGGLLNAGL